MYLGRVIGTVVATQIAPGLTGIKLLMVQPLDDNLGNVGDAQVAVDSTHQAGTNDVVFLVGSREAAQSLEETFVPVDAAVVGIVDQVNSSP